MKIALRRNAFMRESQYSRGPKIRDVEITRIRIEVVDYLVA